MKKIELKHRYGGFGEVDSNIGLIAASTTAGEILCSWLVPNDPVNRTFAGSAVFRPNSLLYPEDANVASGTLSIPLHRVDPTVALVTFLNNSDSQAEVLLAASVGNVDGSSLDPVLGCTSISAGDSTSFQIAFVVPERN